MNEEKNLIFLLSRLSCCFFEYVLIYFSFLVFYPSCRFSYKHRPEGYQSDIALLSSLLLLVVLVGSNYFFLVWIILFVSFEFGNFFN